jgi:hypothetical protein
VGPLTSAGVQVDVSSAQGECLTAAHPGGRQQSPAHGEVRVLGVSPAQEAGAL